MLSPRSVAALAAEGLDEYRAPLAAAGLRSLSDIVRDGVTDGDLRQIGVEKVFHLRRLRRLAEEHHRGGAKPLPPIATAATSDGEPVLAELATPHAEPGSGDHVSLHVLGARGRSPFALGEREHYIKVSLCTLDGHAIVPVEGTAWAMPPTLPATPSSSSSSSSAQRMVGVPDGGGPFVRSVRARGPYPEFVSEADIAAGVAPPMRVRTNFQLGQCIAVQLKEVRRLGRNRTVAVAVFSAAFFHSFAARSVMIGWFPMRAVGASPTAVGSAAAVEGGGGGDAGDAESTAAAAAGPPIAEVRIRFTVPGGAPRAVAKAFRVTSVNMTHRRLRVTVFDAVLPPLRAADRDSSSAAAAISLEGLRRIGGASASTTLSSPSTTTSPPSARDPDAPSTYVQLQLAGGDADSTAAANNGKWRTGIVENSYRPSFDRTFEFAHETTRAKLLVVKIKKVGRFSDTTLGVVQIPLQFWLSQPDSTEVEEVFEALPAAPSPALDTRGGSGGGAVVAPARPDDGRNPRIHLRIAVVAASRATPLVTSATTPPAVSEDTPLTLRLGAQKRLGLGDEAAAAAAVAAAAEDTSSDDDAFAVDDEDEQPWLQTFDSAASVSGTHEGGGRPPAGASRAAIEAILNGTTTPTGGSATRRQRAAAPPTTTMLMEAPAWGVFS